jgi:hypothetical protein
MSKRDDLNIPPWLKAILPSLPQLALFVAIILVAIIALRTVDGWRMAVSNFFNAPTTANVVATDTIVTGLQSMGQLVSLSAQVAKADIAVSANHVAQGAIEAGIDITRISEDSIRYNEQSNTYTITLPAPVITSCRIEYIRQYERNGGNPTCGIDWDNVRLLANYVALDEFAQDMLDGGILERAESETTTVMQSFVSALTGGNVVIRYAETDGTTALPTSCQPQIPAGWTFSEETGEWVRTD